MRVTMFDYGAGNLHSLGKALALAASSVVTETDPRRSLDTDVLVLPGVGAFGHAAAQLAPGLEAMRDAIRGGLPVVGICLGMHLLLDGSDEGAGEGLGIIPGRVTKLAGERVPQIGWNTVEPDGDAPFDGPPLEWVYYANSYVARVANESCVRAWSTHEADRFPAVIQSGRALGVQFHPEKSSVEGVAYLASALQWCAR